MTNPHLLLCIFISLIPFSISPPSPILIQQNPLIESGLYNLFQNSLGSDPITSTYTFQYNVSLTRLPNSSPADYEILLGFYGLDYKIGIDSSNLNKFSLLKTNKLTNSYSIVTVFSDKTVVAFVKVAHLEISKQLGYIYMHQFNKIYNGPDINRIQTIFLPAVFNIGINLVSINIGQPYKTVMSLVLLDSGYSGSGASILECLMSNEISAQYYNISIYTLNLFINEITIQILLLDPVFMVNPQPTKITKINFIQSTAVDTNSQVFYNPLLEFTFGNHFAGITCFQILDDLLYYFYYPTNGQLNVMLKAKTNKLQGYLIIFAYHHCPLPYSYDEINNVCIQCKPECIKCKPTKCLQCVYNFTVSSDLVSCQCPYTIVSHTCFDYQNSPMRGCQSAVSNPLTNNTVQCKFCSISKKLILVNGDCLCQPGYHFNSTNDCTQICGDSITLSQNQCDDGNLINGDGCSSTCQVQNNFKCDNTIQPSYCTSLMELQFNIDSVMKDDDNSAVVKLSPKHKDLPFPLLKEQFLTTSNSQPAIFTLIIKNRSTNETLNIPLHLLSISSNNQIQLQFDIPFMIQSFPAKLTILPYKTRYLPQDDVHNFNITGANQPLRYSNHVGFIKSGKIGAMVQGFVVLVLLAVGLLAPKYIGLQSVVTLQLIFYSQLLIYEAKWWPTGLNILKSLQLVNGYNVGVIQITDYLLLDSNLSKKYYNLSIKKFFIENFNTSGILLIVSFICFLIAMLIRRRKQELMFDKKSAQTTQSRIVSHETSVQYERWVKASNFLFHALSQVAMWCILQILSSMSAMISISNSSVTVIMKEQKLVNQIISLQSVFIACTSTVIFIVGLSYFGNLLMDTITIGKWAQRWPELIYKRVFFIYLIVIGHVVFFLSDLNLILPASMIALIVQLVYMGILLYINPYKLSLRIHTVGLWVCQFVYLMFLLFVNVVNIFHTYILQQQLSQLATLITCYLILICIIAIIILSFIRLYYEYRYGEELQKQIVKQRQQNERQQKIQQQMKLTKKVQILQNEKLKSMDNKQQQMLRNQYLYQNMEREDAMMELLQWLDETRDNWTKQQKEEYYYKHFHVKPLKYLKKNSPKSYHKMIEQQNILKDPQIQRSKILKRHSEQLRQIKQRIKSERINHSLKKHLTSASKRKNGLITLQQL